MEKVLASVKRFLYRPVMQQQKSTEAGARTHHIATWENAEAGDTIGRPKAGERHATTDGLRCVSNTNGRKVFVSKIDPAASLEMNERGGYGALRFFRSGKDHRGNNQGSDLQIRNVGDKNPEAAIQISISQDTFFESTNRTRKEYISFSLPVDMLATFMQAVTQVEQ